MRLRLRTYTAYSIGVAIAWAVLFALAIARGQKTEAPHILLLVFGGFAIGWLSATIARYVYPPPKKYQHPSS
jgi:hypothetical protein